MEGPDERYFGTDAFRRQGGEFYYRIKFQGDDLVKGGQLKSVKLTRLTVDLQPTGKTFPWLNGGGGPDTSDTPKIDSITIGDEKVEIDGEGTRKRYNLTRNYSLRIICETITTRT
jgi:hypothetical protein